MDRPIPLTTVDGALPPDGGLRFATPTLQSFYSYDMFGYGVA